MDHKAQQEAVKAFCEKHLAECCKELLEWKRTALLRDGKVRELAILFDFAGHHALPLAEEAVKVAAMERVVTANAELKGAAQ